MKLTITVFFVVFAAVSADPHEHYNTMGGLPEKYHAMARELFNRANTDTSRDIENNEFWAMFSKFDVNNDKEISESEFVAGFGQGTTMRNTMTAEQLTNSAKAVFVRLDRDKNQKITASDSTAVFNYLDKDKNQTLCLNEFSTLIALVRKVIKSQV